MGLKFNLPNIFAARKGQKLPHVLKTAQFDTNYHSGPNSFVCLRLNDKAELFGETRESLLF